jgi:Ca-activated chloride channel family protein
MATRRRLSPICLAVAAAIGFLASCSSKEEQITIAAGSENRQLEPLVTEFCKEQGAKCTFRYQGSLDIGLALKAGNLEADVVWPAASIWVDIFDTGRKVRDLQSIAQSPVLLGVRKSKAEALGWTSRAVTTHDILDAVAAGKLTFLMSSATQSNSGASAYLAMLTTMIGADVLTEPDLADTKLRTEVRQMLSGVVRTSGSSGWLGELFLDQDARGVRYDAMWNYETVLKETNDTLTQRGSEPLWLVYPADGVAMADAPVAYLDRGRGEDVHTFVTDLQKFLLTAESQTRIANTGRRVGLGRAKLADPVQAWNFDPSRPVTVVRPPEPDVILAALNLYQEALRRPSFSVLCLDVSGSMEGDGISQLHDAMSFLFNMQTTREVLVQWSSEDRIMLIPFSDTLGQPAIGVGQPADQDRLREFGLSLQAGGGTNMYQCASAALKLMHDDTSGEGHLPAILIMTDGKSEDYASDFMRDWQADGRRIPVFGILFGDADSSQLDKLAQETGGRVFDGRTSLLQAFRAARGYN